MSRFNESAVMGDAADHLIVGAPREFFGFGSVAFVDLLGFRSSVKRDWSNSDAPPAAYLVKLRDHFDGSQVSSVNLQLRIDGQRLRVYKHRVHTIADAFTIATAIPTVNRAVEIEDLMMAAMNLASNALELWKVTLEHGYSIRGAIEYGPIFWDDRTITGPAPINAYQLESRLAKDSRLIVGPHLLHALLHFAEQKGHMEIFDQVLGAFDQHADGLIAVRELGMQRCLPALKALREKAGDKASKYDALIERIERPFSEAPTVGWADVRTGLQKLLEASNSPEVAAP